MLKELFRFERDKYFHSSRMILPLILLFFYLGFAYSMACLLYTSKTEYTATRATMRITGMKKPKWKHREAAETMRRKKAAVQKSDGLLLRPL